MPSPREQLSEAMRTARLEAGFATHSKMAKALNMSRPAISKAESPIQAIPSVPLLTAWARACRVPVEEFLEIVQRAKSGASEWFMPYLGAEQLATSVRLWQPSLVPGLCQTESYARAIEKTEAAVSQRLERQQILGRTRVVAVIEHSVLQRCIGSARIMTEQCGHLAALVESEKVRLHVVPEGANTGLGGALAIASSKHLVTVALTTMIREITSTAADVVEDAMAGFDEVLGAALGAVPSLEYVRDMEETWKER